ncbi:MAG: acyltransferase family protein [Bacilli bacterium]
MPEPIKSSGRYMAGLDGLRALAVFAVIAYHLNLAWAPGGLLGVDVFFVLSGYLITDLLVAQWDRSGRLNLKDFWLRRARRLLPALFVMLVVVAAWITLFERAQLPPLRGDVLAAMLFVSNWWFIFHHVAYFARFGPPSPLGHLWSLAVEEQFYLLWPLALALGLRGALRRRRLVWLTLAGALASALAMALIYQPGADPSRVYYGTDTRAFALLIGAVLALVWPSRKLSATVSLRARLTLDLAGAAGLLVVFFMIWRTNQYEVFLYRGGMVLLSVAAAAAVATLAHPASLLSRALGWKPLRWLGVRSYVIYLWHYPVIVLTSPAVNTGGVDFPRAILQVAASIGLAALSWRFVEEPIRHGAAGRLWTQARTREWRWSRPSISVWIASVSALFVFVVSCVGIAGLVPAAIASSPPHVTSIGTTKPMSTLLRKHESTPSSDSNTASQARPPGTLGNPMSGLGSAAGCVATAKATPEAGQGVTAIGDSIMIDAAPYLRKLLPGIVIDAQIGRQMFQAQAVTAHLKLKGELGRRVIIELGTNGSFTNEQLISLLHSLGKVQQIVLVNTRVPRPWEGVVNSTLAEVAKTFPHTTLVNWYTASVGKNAYFYPDGVHLNPEGTQFYAGLIAKAVNPQPKRNGPCSSSRPLRPYSG